MIDVTVLKKCPKCGLALPPGHPKTYCSGPRHACWCNDELNQWRIDNGIIDREQLVESFMGSIESHIVIRP